MRDISGLLSATCSKATVAWPPALPAPVVVTGAVADDSPSDVPSSARHAAEPLISARAQNDESVSTESLLLPARLDASAMMNALTRSTKNSSTKAPHQARCCSSALSLIA